MRMRAHNSIMSEDEEGMKRDPDEEESSSEEEEEEVTTTKKRSSSSKDVVRKQQRRAGGKKGGFFDEAASEGSDEDDEAYEDRDAKESDDDENPADKKYYDKIRPEMKRAYEAKSAEELARGAEDRARALRAKQLSGADLGQAVSLDTVRMIRERPGSNDPRLFAVKCGVGEEKQLIIRLYQKYIHDKQKVAEPLVQVVRNSRFAKPPPPGAELEIFSILCPGTAGYIYVEARKEECVRAALRGVSKVFSSKISIVPQHEMQDVLRVEMNKTIIRAGQYIRLKGPFPYKGDLAKVIETMDASTKVIVCVVPRLDVAELLASQNSASAQDEGGAKKKIPNSQKLVPPSKYFNADELKEAGLRLDSELYAPLGKACFMISNRAFYKGLMFFEINDRYIQSDRISMKPEEVTRLNPGEAEDKQEEILAEAFELVAATSKEIESAYDLSVNDKVCVINGPETGLRNAIVESIDRKSVVVRAGTLKIEMDVKSIAKQFDVGDHVKISHGKHAGKTGVVLMASFDDPKRPTVTLATDFTKEELEVSNGDVRISKQVSHGLDVLGGYRMYDLVMLDQNQHGIVVRVNMDSLRILLESGEVKEVPPSAIRQNKNRESKNASTADQGGNVLRQGDRVNVISNQHADVEGVIKQIHRLFLFIHSPKLESENAGIVVVKARDVRVSGTVFEANRPDAQTQAGSRVGGSSAMPPPRMGGGPLARGGHRRDELVGKTVRITVGNDRGLLGVVLEGGSETNIRLELAARNRVLMVPRGNVVEVKGDGMGAFGEFPGFGAAKSSAFASAGGSSFGPATPSKDAPVKIMPRFDSLSQPSSLLTFKRGDTVKILSSGRIATFERTIGLKEVIVNTDGRYTAVLSDDLGTA